MIAEQGGFVIHGIFCWGIAPAENSIRSNYKTMKIVRPLIVCATMVAISSCSNSVTADSSSTLTAEQGVPGGEIVRTTTLDATVTAINSSKREVSLISRHGEKFEVEAGPGIANFNQIRVGDFLKVSLQEHLVVRMAKPGEKLDDEAWVSGRGAPRGSMPGAKVSSKEQYVGTITAINTKKRKVTLGFSDGSSANFDVRSDIDLSKYHTGEKVLIRLTESLAVSMKKP